MCANHVWAPLQAAACTDRVAFGPRAGQKVLTVRVTLTRETRFNLTLRADMQGFQPERPGAM